MDKDIIANLEELTINVPENRNQDWSEFLENVIIMPENQQNELMKSIEIVGYKNSLNSENELRDALENGPKSVDFTKFVSFLTMELRELCNLDECVNTIMAPEDSITFLMELSSFLNELGCPHGHLTQGHVSERLGTVEDRILLLQYLISELMAARILRENCPEKRIDLKLRESTQAGDLRKILQILGFSKPPANITMQTLFQKITPSIQNLVQKAHKDLIGHPIFNFTLTAKQWEVLDNVDRDLHEEYMIRREMLLKRLDCTIQSFQWSDKTKGKDALFEKTYVEQRKTLKAEPSVDVSDLMASRDDLAIIEKTSSAAVRKNTKSSINKVIIGEVPDRGGRTEEQQPPPPEMPPWQQRNSGPSGGGQFNRGGANFSRGGGNSRGGNNSFDSAGSYGGRGDSQRGGEYARANDYCRDSNDYSRGGVDHSKGRNNYSGRGGNFSRGSNYSGGNNAHYSRNDSGGYSQSYRSSGGGYDSAGSYGGYSQEHQEPKRAKTYDQFQQNSNTYADQYVQESQHNMQYQTQDRDNRNRGHRRGRSNYNRGGGRYR